MFKINQNIYNKIGELGVYIYTLSLFISKSGVNIGLGFLVLAFLLYLWDKRKIKLTTEEKYILVILVLLPIFSLFSAGGTHSFQRALEKSYRYLPIFFIPLFITNERVIKIILSLFSLSIFISFINGIFFYKKLKWNFNARLISFSSHPLDEAHILAMGSLLLLALLIYTLKFKKYKELPIYLLAFILALIALVMTQGRGAWLGFLGGLFVVVFLLMKNKKLFIVAVILVGVLGVGDLLIKLGLKYGAPESLEFCDKVARTIIDTALSASALLAKEYGAFPRYKEEKILQSPFLLENASTETMELIKEYGLRNSQLLTIAPTGSIGTMLEISTGIEPNFAFSFTRKTESLHGEDVYYKVFIPIAKKYMEDNNLTEEDELPDYFVTAQNLNPYDRIKMQGVWQKRIDASISSTINLVNKVSVEEVEHLYIEGWKNGLKGMTIYRAGCDREGILTVEKKEEKNPEQALKEKMETIARGELKPIAPDTIYYPHKMRIGCGKLKVMIGYSPRERAIQDLYVIRSGTGGCEKNIQAVAIYMSGILRLGGNLFMLEDAIDGVSGCTSFAVARSKNLDVSQGSTCPSAILNVLKKFEKNMGLSGHSEAIQKIDEEERKEKELVAESEKRKTICPECGVELEITGGCYTCRNCGYSKCE